MDNKPRSGRPVTYITDKNIKECKIEQLCAGILTTGYWLDQIFVYKILEFDLALVKVKFE